MTATHDCRGVIAKNTKVLELPCCDTGRNSVIAKSNVNFSKTIVSA